jgi:Kinesin motor domain
MPVRRTDSPEVVERSSREALQRMGQAGKTPSSPLTTANLNTLSDMPLPDMFVKRLESGNSGPRSIVTAPTAEPADSSRPMVIRAKVSTVAVPRRKVGLPGAEHANPAPNSPKSSVDVHPSSGYVTPRPKLSLGRHAREDEENTVHPSSSIPDTTCFSSKGRPSESEGADEEDEDFPPVEFGEDNVVVCVRVRPPASGLGPSRGDGLSLGSAWDIEETKGTIGTYAFDSVVTGSSNREVYGRTAKTLVKSAMEGYDSLVFAYGQTASGKTFTLVKSFRPFDLGTQLILRN